MHMLAFAKSNLTKVLLCPMGPRGETNFKLINEIKGSKFEEKSFFIP